MPTADARVETDRASRYLAQLCQHFSHQGRHLCRLRRIHGAGHTQTRTFVSP
jgi:hypothetical protein